MELYKVCANGHEYGHQPHEDDRQEIIDFSPCPKCGAPAKEVRLTSPTAVPSG